jgi:prephenate dehydrogenase
MPTPRTLLLLGHGRFGRTLHELAAAAGWRVRAHDPLAEVPAAIRAASAQELLAEPGLVLPAVPVEGLREVLAAARPHLGARHAVVEVGSVKHDARRALVELLGEAVPWVQTHPLFGPMSVALGREPLRVVLCPDTPHPGALGAARELFADLGCVLHEEASEEHDRAMALTQALTFFVAKGLLEVGADRVEVTPPSFRAMAASIDSVRADAGHLFLPIQNGNPHAAEARERLLDTLTRLHRELAEAGETGVVGGEALAIPPADPGPELGEVRAGIDALDQELVELLARRSRFALRAARAKAGGGRAVQDPTREEALLERRRELAREHGLDPGAVTDVFEAILRFSRSTQRRYLDSGAPGGEA